MKNPQSNLPPGFRFHPTDEELIRHYLKKKVSSATFPVSIIADVDIYKFDPWELPDKATFGEKEWYFFSPRDRKYPNGARPNRAAGSGYWKATGTDKIIMAPQIHNNNSQQQHHNIGVKKALVFYMGRPPKGVKTNWIMHEYRLSDSVTCHVSNTKPMKSKDSSMRLDDFVLCRIYKKSNALHPSIAAATISSDHDQEEEEEEIMFAQETKFPTLKAPPTLVIGENQNQNQPLMSQKSCSFSNLLDAVDYSVLSSFLWDNNNNTAQFNNSTGYNDYSTFNNAISEQPNLFNCYNNNGNGNSGGSNFGAGNSYLVQKQPNQFNTGSNVSSNGATEFLKRQYSNVEEDLVQYPSKKFINSCSFISTNTSSQNEYNSLLSQPFLNQHSYF